MALNRTQMEQVIREGGGVLYQGRTITTVEELPSEADLAKGNPDAEVATRQKLQEDMARIQAELAKLTQPGQPTGAAPSEGGEGEPSADPNAETQTARTAGRRPKPADEKPAEGEEK